MSKVINLEALSYFYEKIKKKISAKASRSEVDSLSATVSGVDRSLSTVKSNISKIDSRVSHNETEIDSQRMNLSLVRSLVDKNTGEINEIKNSDPVTKASLKHVNISSRRSKPLFYITPADDQEGSIILETWPGLMVSDINAGYEFNPKEVTTETITIEKGNRLYCFSDYPPSKISVTGRYNVGGCFSWLALSTDNADFRQMFFNDTNIVDASEAILDIVCRANNMFSHATSLVKAPQLPLKHFGKYWGMFSECTSLKVPPPELPCIDVENINYNNMFYSCTALEQAPALPALELTGPGYGAKYSSMFKNCTSLKEVRMMALDLGELVKDSYYQHTKDMLSRVSPTGKLVINKDADWNPAYVAPAGWTVERVTPSTGGGSIDSRPVGEETATPLFPYLEYVKQNLTFTQQEQARKNIDAASEADLDQRVQVVDINDIMSSQDTNLILVMDGDEGKIAEILPSCHGEEIGWLYDWQEGWRVADIVGFRYFGSTWLDLLRYMEEHSTPLNVLTYGVVRNDVIQSLNDTQKAQARTNIGAPSKSEVQPKLTAGENITIENNVISSTGGSQIIIRRW